MRQLNEFLKSKKEIAILLTVFAVCFNAVSLLPEVTIPAIPLNDEILHYSLAAEAGSALKEGKDATDFWLSKITLGYPLFHYYQHLPQVVLALVNQLTGPFFSLSGLFDVSRYLLLVFFPLSIFWAMRRFGFDYLAGGLAALISSLFSTNGLFGFDYNSYVWRGTGLYPQLWAMFFLPLALAEIYRYLNKKTHLFWPVFLGVIVLLSQVFYGYILFLSAFIFIFLRPEKQEIFSRAKRLIIVILLIGAVSSYFLVPLLQDRDYLNRSIFEPSWKYDSFGAKQVLLKLSKGELLDFGRLPFLSLFLLMGIIAITALKKYKEENFRLVLALFIFWLCLFFGRPTWGVFLNLLPGSQFLHLHRFIGGFHLASIMAIGAGLAAFFEWIYSHRPSRFRWLVGAALVFIVLLVPVYKERLKFYSENALWKLENHNAFKNFQGELQEIESTLLSLPPGRVFAGLPHTWGDYPYYKVGYIPFYIIFSRQGFDSFGYAYHSEDLTGDLRLNFDDKRQEQYNLFNIRYVLLHKTWTPAYYYSRIKEFENYVLYEAPTTGYFDLVAAPAVFYGEKKDFYQVNFQWLSGGLPQLKQHPILEIGQEPKKTFGLPVFAFDKVDENLLSDITKAVVTLPTGQIYQEGQKMNEYWAQFTASQEGYLMLKANFHPGWQAVLDGNQVSPVMLSPGFIGVKVSPGTHFVIFTYYPPFYRSWLLILGGFVLLALFLDRFKPFFNNCLKKILGNFSKQYELL